MMRIRSLDALDGDPGQVQATVCIIGAGAAGLYLAHRLGQAGCRTVVLEAGPRTPVPPDTAGFESILPSDHYGGATQGRAFGLGGTTSVWGGQLIAFAPRDGLRDDPVQSRAWRQVLGPVERHRHAVADVLGALPDPAPPSAPPLELPAELTAVASQWLPFGRRNLARLATQDRAPPDTVDVYCDAVASRWTVTDGHDGKAAVREVTARSPSGRCVRVRAGHFVIAAGAIESTRILQEIDLAGAGSVLRPGAAVGHYLSDHLSVRIADTGRRARRRIAAACGPRFRGGLMQTWRFVETDPTPVQPRYFAHVVFPTDDSGFQLARTVLQAWQAKARPSIGLRGLSAGAAGLVRLAWCRWAQQRLYLPADADSHLQLDVEQRPRHANRVQLGATLDRYERPVPRIDWTVSDADRNDLERARAAFLSHWSAVDDAFTPPSPDGAGDPSLKPHDAFHPVGTCRIGDDREAVVDRNLDVHGAGNLSVLSTAVFPSAGSANPTFSLLCLAEMLATRLATESRGP